MVTEYYACQFMAGKVDIAHGGSCTPSKREDLDHCQEVLAWGLANAAEVPDSVQLLLQDSSTASRRCATTASPRVTTASVKRRARGCCSPHVVPAPIAGLSRQVPCEADWCLLSSFSGAVDSSFGAYSLFIIHYSLF